MNKKLIFCFIILFLAACGKGVITKEATGQGSTCFQNVAVEIDEDGKGILYAHSKDKFFVETVEVSFLNTCAIYDGKLYYLNSRQKETADLSGDEDEWFIFCCDLEEIFEDERMILELTGLKEKGIKKLCIQEGFLFCAWVTKEETEKCAVAELESGTVTEFSALPEIQVEAVTASGYYYLNLGKIYFSDYEGENTKLFFETDRDIETLYMEGENVCVMLEQEGIISMIVVDKKGKIQNEYNGFEKVEGLQDVHSPRLLRQKGGILYYIVTGKKAGTSYNTWLIRMDMEGGARENCGGWYVKRED